MAKEPAEHGQKIKLLKLFELLKQESDEAHPMTTADICKRMEESGIPCDRRTLSQDIDLLTQNGYKVISERHGNKNFYYVQEHNFSLPELKILMDAVHAANFIPEEKANDLIIKIAALGESHYAELLHRNQPCFNTHRHSNEHIYYIINECETALQQKMRLSFYYFDLDSKLRRVYRKNKKKYEVDPMALILNNNNYYLMCYSSKYDGITNYRLDRMDEATVLEEPVNEGAIIHAADVPDFTRQAFSMYGGPTVNAVLQFSKDLIGVIFDQFGEGTQMIPQDSNTYIATVQIQKSPTFWGWFFTLGKDIKILSPEPLISDWKEQVRLLNENLE